MSFDAYTIVVSLPAIVLGLTVHEYAHALAADRLGDPTARLNGRLTLEPWAHLDPIGLLMIVFYRFGWAKPVPVEPRHMRNPSRGLAISAMAGPLANLLLAFVFGILWATGAASLAGAGAAQHLARIISNGVLINTGLFVFNLLPIPPLDGSRILAWVAPVERWPAWHWLAAYGPLVLLLLLVSGAGSYLIGGPATAVINVIVSVSTAIARLF